MPPPKCTVAFKKRLSFWALDRIRSDGSKWMRTFGYRWTTCGGRCVATASRGGIRFAWWRAGGGGSSQTGAINPLDALAGFASESNLWMHVDGAYGAAAMLDPQSRPLLEGIERADSIALDPHKSEERRVGKTVDICRR